MNHTTVYQKMEYYSAAFWKFCLFHLGFLNIAFKIQSAQIHSDRRVYKCTSADTPKECQPNWLMKRMDSTSACLCNFRHKSQYEAPSWECAVSQLGGYTLSLSFASRLAFSFPLLCPLFAEDLFEKSKEKPVSLLCCIRFTACFLLKPPSCRLHWRHHNQYRSPIHWHS